jgi:hypothetical protein
MPVLGLYMRANQNDEWRMNNDECWKSLRSVIYNFVIATFLEETKLQTILHSNGRYKKV